MIMSDVQTFIYYGVVLNKLESHNLAIKNQYDNIYDLAFSNDLNFQYIGRESYSDRVVIGKEVFWDYGKNLIEINLIDNKLNLMTENVEGEDNKNSIKIENEEEIKNILQNLGVLNQEPKYYIVSVRGIME